MNHPPRINESFAVEGFPLLESIRPVIPTRFELAMEPKSPLRGLVVPGHGTGGIGGNTALLGRQLNEETPARLYSGPGFPV